MDIKGVKNIIFDFGGIFLNIDYSLTEKAFGKLSDVNIATYYSQHKQNGLFDQFETGKIDADTFRNQVILDLNMPNDFNLFDKSWSAMLLDIPLEKMNQLEIISQKFRIFLYSNTNIIHYNAFREIIDNQHSFTRFENCFEKTYYSHTFGHRKPNKEGFQIILSENNLSISETLFIDDTEGHIISAREMGFQTIFQKSNAPLPQILFGKN